MDNLNQPSLNRNYGSRKVHNFTKRLIKCSSCPSSDLVPDDGREIIGDYVCHNCIDRPRVIPTEPSTVPPTDEKPIT